MDNKKINLETEFKNKLKQFKTIASELSSIWEQIDARYHFAPKYTVKYPFKDSFDEKMAIEYFKVIELRHCLKVLKNG